MAKFPPNLFEMLIPKYSLVNYFYEPARGCCTDPVKHVTYKDCVHAFIKFDKSFIRTESILNVTVLNQYLPNLDHGISNY